jgi:hypothetical protein
MMVTVGQEEIMDDGMTEGMTEEVEEVEVAEEDIIEDAMSEIEYPMDDVFDIEDEDSMMEDEYTEYIIDDEIEIRSDISDYSDWPTDDHQGDNQEDHEDERTILDCLTYEEMVEFLDSIEPKEVRFFESLSRRIPYCPVQAEERPMTSSLCSERPIEEINQKSDSKNSLKENLKTNLKEAEDELEAFVRRLIDVSEHVASKVTFHSNKIRDQLLSVCLDPILELSRKVAEQIRRLSIIICQKEFSRRSQQTNLEQTSFHSDKVLEEHIIEFRINTNPEYGLKASDD